MYKVTILLKEYSNIFPHNFMKRMVIKGELGETRIWLKPNIKPIKKRLYRLNPRVKQKIKEEIDNILMAILIFLV